MVERNRACVRDRSEENTVVGKVQVNKEFIIRIKENLTEKKLAENITKPMGHKKSSKA